MGGLLVRAGDSRPGDGAEAHPSCKRPPEVQAIRREVQDAQLRVQELTWDAGCSPEGVGHSPGMQGTHLGLQGAHLGVQGTHLGVLELTLMQGMHLGVQGAHLGCLPFIAALWGSAVCLPELLLHLYSLMVED